MHDIWNFFGNDSGTDDTRGGELGVRCDLSIGIVTYSPDS